MLVHTNDCGSVPLIRSLVESEQAFHHRLEASKGFACCHEWRLYMQALCARLAYWFCV